MHHFCSENRLPKIFFQILSQKSAQFVNLRNPDLGWSQESTQSVDFMDSWSVFGFSQKNPPLRVLYRKRLEKRQIHVSTKNSKQTVLKLVVPEGTFLWPIILSTLLLNHETSIKIDKNHPLALSKGPFHHSYSSKIWKGYDFICMHGLSLWFTKAFYFIFAPVWMDQHFKTRGWESKHHVEPSRNGTFWFERLNQKPK